MLYVQCVMMPLFNGNRKTAEKNGTVQFYKKTGNLTVILNKTDKKKEFVLNITFCKTRQVNK